MIYPHTRQGPGMQVGMLDVRCARVLFPTKQFENILLEMATKPASEQKQILNQKIEDWKGRSHEQVDDICVIGVFI